MPDPRPARLASGPRRIDGARPALFERLLGAGPAPRLYDADGLRAAIAASLSDLLSVRPPVEAIDRPAAARTILDYGAAPEAAQSPAREADRDRLAAAIREAVAAFEPRLADPAVAIVPDPDAPDGLLVRVSGAMRLGRALEPFAFVAPWRPAGGGVAGQGAAS